MKCVVNTYAESVEPSGVFSTYPFVLFVLFVVALFLQPLIVRDRLMKIRLTLLTAAACLLAGVVIPAASAAEPIKLDSVLLTLIEQVEVPAREAGELSAMHVREGQLVKEGTLLAQIDDRDAQLAARKARFECDIAAKEAGNDVHVRFHKKSREVAEAELRRAIESIEKYRKSVSETEMDRLRLTAEKTGLEVEQAELELAKAKLTERLKDNDVKIAERSIERRNVVSPIDGMVVQILHRRGEFVEAGHTVLRVLRINRLRAEGLLNARDLRGEPVGRRVTLTVMVPGSGETQFAGKVVFVSPEINPVSGQTKVWAEIENPDLLLRPGLNGAMTIEAEAAKLK
jgi:RND family efflux transporter MFP subunit